MVKAHQELAASGDNWPETKKKSLVAPDETIQNWIELTLVKTQNSELPLCTSLHKIILRAPLTLAKGSS